MSPFNIPFARGLSATLTLLSFAASCSQAASTDGASGQASGLGGSGSASGSAPDAAGSGGASGGGGSGATGVAASGATGQGSTGAGSAGNSGAVSGTAGNPASDDGGADGAPAASEAGSQHDSGGGVDGDVDGSTPGKVVLFDGTSFDDWESLADAGPVPWKLVGDGTMVVAPGTGYIRSKRTFGNLFVHVEYKTPVLAATVTGQQRGNSGVYLNGMYEMQVLDTAGLPPAIDGCGAVYQVKVPLVSACFGQDVWNTYEVDFTAARFDAQGKKVSDARITAHLNGMLVQDNTDVPMGTKSGHAEVPGPGPLVLQDHLNAVSFRNIWVIPRM